MKTQMGLYLDVATAEALRDKAAASGASISDLADLVMRYGLARIGDDALRKWALKQGSTRGRNAGGLRQNERAALGAIERLKAAQAPAWRFSGADVAAAAAMKLSEAFWALKSLQTRGLVHGFELDELDRWGRPTRSFWCLTADRQA